MILAPGLQAVLKVTGEPATLLPVAPRCENSLMYYYAAVGGHQQKMWIRESDFENTPSRPKILFNRRSPDLIVVDNFLKEPDTIRQFALQTYLL